MPVRVKPEAESRPGERLPSAFYSGYGATWLDQDAADADGAPGPQMMTVPNANRATTVAQSLTFTVFLSSGLLAASPAQ